MWESVATELLHLWTNGVELILNNAKVTVFICLTAIKGDWPLLAKLGCLERFFGRKTKSSNQDKAKGICHLCLAGKSGFPFHDCMDTALWRTTFLQHSPFWQPSPFACLPYHQPLLYRFDVFHVCHKGVLAELAGSGLVVLMDLGKAGPGDVHVQLATLYEELVSFNRRNSLNLHMSSLTRTLVNLTKDADYPCGTWFKGQDTSIVNRFLEERFGTLLAEEPSDYVAAIHEAVSKANSMMRHLYAHGLWYRRFDAEVFVRHTYGFMTKYLEVAYMALSQRKTRFKLTPKLHAFNHIADYVRNDLEKYPLAQWLRNPATWSTQQCEDFTGRVSQLSTAVSSRACHRQVMCRYAVNLWKHW
ncbi:unnamed protein product [Symbiodinium sp. CCMP2592]|nr:unnamed protein product [Symbiodinium sp. CCMP2592]